MDCWQGLQSRDQGRIALDRATDLIVASLVQYDSTVGHVGVNARLQWTIAPGRDFFMVLNHGVEASVTDPYARALPVGNVVTAKLRWDFRK